MNSFDSAAGLRVAPENSGHPPEPSRGFKFLDTPGGDGMAEIELDDYDRAALQVLGGKAFTDLLRSMEESKIGFIDGDIRRADLDFKGRVAELAHDTADLRAKALNALVATPSARTNLIWVLNKQVGLVFQRVRQHTFSPNDATSWSRLFEYVCQCMKDVAIRVDHELFDALGEAQHEHWNPEVMKRLMKSWERIVKEIVPIVTKAESVPVTGSSGGVALTTELPAKLETIVSKPIAVGVSYRDAAKILNDADESLVAEAVAAWNKKREQPESIGFDPQHSQRKLYAPTALVNFLENSGAIVGISKAELFKRLTALARTPLQK
jgi:hypothetical protein